MATFKQMTYVRERYPEAKIYVFYIDLRTPGKYEHFREKLMSDENAEFIKGKVADICVISDIREICTDKRKGFAGVTLFNLINISKK